MDKLELPSDWEVTRVQIEINYNCNKQCGKCNRHCNLKMPYHQNADMTISQIEKFIKQVKDNNIALNRVEIMGGEPFLHPKLNEIIYTIYHGLMITGYLEQMNIYHNGTFGNEIELRTKYLNECMEEHSIRNAFDNGSIRLTVSQKHKERTFMHVLAAPVDLELSWSICSWPYECGILLNTYGYWPGGVCGAIALLFGNLEYKRRDFPIRFRETWPNIRNDICQYCAAGCGELNAKKNGDVTSSYRKVLKHWREIDKYSLYKF